jgi:hypothetical protein
VTLFLEAHKTPPAEITIDLDATDDPLHGNQEGRFFHGYYDCFVSGALRPHSGGHRHPARCCPMSKHRFDHSDDTKEVSAPARPRRIEVLTGVERRRRRRRPSSRRAWPMAPSSLRWRAVTISIRNSCSAGERVGAMP